MCTKPTVCSPPHPPPPLPLASVLSGNRLLQIPQEGVKPLVGTVGSRTRDSPHCRVPLSFNELMPVELLGPPSRLRLQDISWRLTGDLSPQLRDPAQPHSSGCPALNITQRAPCRQGRNTPSLRLRVYRCFPSGLFFLT